jgi:cytochrome c oxidase subunit 2
LLAAAVPVSRSLAVRFWSILFAIAAIFCIGVYLYAPFAPDWWLPHNVSVRGLGFGAEVDHLFVIILWITGLTFIGTQLALVYVMWKFPASPGRKAWFLHGSHRLEVVWTIIPTAILVFIALYQMGAWTRIKFRTSQPRVRPTAEVTARQFQWKIKYPGLDGKLGTPDDLHLVNDLHFVKGTPVVIMLKSEDVLHSFFLPNMRIKQDAVPGLTIPVWFDSDEAGTFDLVCAELCGWGHYKMRGVVTVHETQRDFDEWLNRSLAAQSLDQLAAAPAAPNSGGE